MGSISIIARRLQDGHVQYGYSGNGGYFQLLGNRLLQWYQDPEMIEYLFGLGQLSLLEKPGSEIRGSAGLLQSHQLTGRPHYLGTSERQIFSQIAFIDFGYFYDLDNTWYYVIPGPFRIKMPLTLVSNNLDEDGTEFTFLKKVEIQLVQYIFNEYLKDNPHFAEYLNSLALDVTDIQRALLQAKHPIHALFDNFHGVFKYFDDWVLVTTNDDCTKQTGFKIHKKADKHLETIKW